MSSVKFVYTLISDGCDLYTEQFCASSYSLRYHNPSAEIIVITDLQTINDIHEQCLDELFSYVDNKIVINIPEKYNKVQRSRYLKTSVRNIIDGDCLCLDTDVVITCKLDINDINDNVLIGAVYDCHNSGKPIFRKEQKDLISFLFEEDKDVDVYYNSGVMYVKDDDITRKFYDKWHCLWKKSVEFGKHYDQPSLGVVNKMFGNIIMPIPFYYNVQVNLNSMLYLTNAKVVHLFYGSNIDYNLRNILSDYFSEIYVSIKNNKSIGDLEKYKVIYFKEQLIPYVEHQGLFEMKPIYQYAYKAYQDYPIVFFLLRAFVYILRKFCH